MTLIQTVIQGGSHASRSLYRHSGGGPAADGLAAANPFATARLRPQMFCRCAAQYLVGGSGLHHFGFCRVPALAAGAIRRDSAASVVGHVTKLCGAATPA